MFENILQVVGKTGQSNHYSDEFTSPRDCIPGFIQPDGRTNMPDVADQMSMSAGTSPILPATGSFSHNVMRMLNGPSVATSHDARPAQYSTAHFLSFRHKMLNQQVGTEYKEDVHDLSSRNLSSSDMSVSSDGSLSPPISGINTSTLSSNSFDSSRASGTPPLSEQSISSLESSHSSFDSSPHSECESTSTASLSKTAEDSPEKNSNKNQKKGARTNYTNEQIQALLKIFHETPYPDSEMMETIGKDLGIPEKKVKIWFQNKRARWRRRVNELTNNNNVHPFIPAPPMMSPVTPFGYMPNGYMMTSSPAFNMNDYNWMSASPLGNKNVTMPGQFSNNQIPAPYFPTNHRASFQNHAYPASPMTSFPPTMSPAYYNRPLSQQNVMSQTTRPNSYSMNGGLNQTLR